MVKNMDSWLRELAWSSLGRTRVESSLLTTLYEIVLTRGNENTCANFARLEIASEVRTRMGVGA